MWLRRDDMSPEYVKDYFKSAKEIINELYYDYHGFLDTDKAFFGLYVKDLGACFYGGRIKFSTRPQNSKNIMKFEEFMKWVATEEKRNKRK